MMQSGAKAREMRVNFQLKKSNPASTKTTVLGSLIRSERPRRRKLLRPALSASMRVMSSFVVVFWKKSRERELTLRKASRLTSLVMRWPLQASR